MAAEFNPRDWRYRRLRLREPGEADLGIYLQMFGNEQVMAMLGGAASASHTAERLQRHLSHWRESGLGPWVAELADSGAFVGCGGLHYRGAAGASPLELGYALLPEFWGQGLASEFALGTTHAAFGLLGEQELLALTQVSHRASRRVLERVGFQYRRELMHFDLPHVEYGCTGKVWLASSSGIAAADFAVAAQQGAQ